MNQVDCYCTYCGATMRITDFRPGYNFCCKECYRAYKHRMERLEAVKTKHNEETY